MRKIDVFFPLRGDRQAGDAEIDKPSEEELIRLFESPFYWTNEKPSPEIVHHFILIFRAENKSGTFLHLFFLTAGRGAGNTRHHERSAHVRMVVAALIGEGGWPSVS